MQRLRSLESVKVFSTLPKGFAGGYEGKDGEFVCEHGIGRDQSPQHVEPLCYLSSSHMTAASNENDIEAHYNCARNRYDSSPMLTSR